MSINDGGCIFRRIKGLYQEIIDILVRTVVGVFATRINIKCQIVAFGKGVDRNMGFRQHVLDGVTLGIKRVLCDVQYGEMIRFANDVQMILDPFDVGQQFVIADVLDITNHVLPGSSRMFVGGHCTKMYGV